MFPSPAPRRGTFAATLKRDLVQRTAASVLVLRVIEGLSVWLLFTHSAFSASLVRYGTTAWLIQALFPIYFAVNFLCYYRQRSRRTSETLLWTDLLTNLGVVLVVSAHTGGLASPAMLICFVKIAVYGFVYSPLIGITATTLALAVVAGFVGGSEFFGVDWTPGWKRFGGPAAATLLPEFLVVAGALSAAIWLFNQVAEKEQQTRVEGNRAKRAADREHAAATITAALLSVSEAVSRLTVLDEVLNKVVEIAPRILSVDYCAIFLWADDDQIYRGAAVSGLDPTTTEELLRMRLSAAEVPDLEWVRRLGHCAVIGPRDAERFGIVGAPLLLTAPLLSGGRFYGVLQFSRRSGRSFMQTDLRLADGIAGQAAVAIERARLVDQSHRLVRAVESTDEAVLIADRHRRTVFANPAFLQMFGFTWEEIAGRDAAGLAGTLAESWVIEVQNTVSEHAWRGETVAERKNGQLFPVAVNASLIRSPDNRIEGAVAILEDITAKKQLQEQLARADRLAAAGELAAGVAHEVNNALVSILGQAELGRTSLDTARLQQALQNVETQGRRIADIVQDLLGFARPQTPQRGAIDLGQLVRDTLALMAHDLGRHGVRTETVAATALPPVLADAKQIQQVLVNLFTNAMQALQPGGGLISVRLQKDGSSVLVNVSDDGPGIPADVVARVFDPFFSTKEGGTGLGLSVSYAIVRAHGGDLTVNSTPQQGTTFTLQLPVVAESESPPVQTLLLVDDDDAVAETLESMLTREGLAVQRAASGAEALAALAARDFDAIFLDVRLPDISGPEIYARLARDRPDLARRVAFVTGGLWRADNRSLRDQLPPQPMLSKPCTAAQIRDVLRLLRDSRAAA